MLLDKAHENLSLTSAPKGTI